MFTNDANGPYCWKCSLNVEWHDCTFCPSIRLRRGLVRRSGSHTTPLPAATILPNPARRKNLFKPMKAILPNPRRPRGFTLVELLTVIAIIGILAAMLLPVLAAVKKHALIMKARTEMSALVNDIQAYDQAYGRFPVSQQAQTQAAANATKAGQSPDFTYGGVFQDPYVPGGKVQVGTYVNAAGNILSNADVVAILMDITNYPTLFSGGGGATADVGHVKNPQQTKFLNAKMSGWDPTQPGQTGPPPAGVDNTLTYRDPWGNPYIITMDLNYDDQCMDDVYRMKGVSQNPPKSSSLNGYNGLTSLPSTTNPNNFQFHGKVMVWSAGPDGKLDKGTPAIQDVNKDNILSWQ